MGSFVDVHSHVVPSGDDGAQSIAMGRSMCREAARRGTAVLFATPHVWPHLPLTAEREEQVRAAHAELAPQAGLELRLGFELTPTPRLLDEDLSRYALEGTRFVLIEVPFTGGVDLLVRLCEQIEDSGLQPLIAHPERTESVLEQPSVANELAERGWALQVNATSLVGHHGAEIEALAWSLIDQRIVAIVASDGHRPLRPPHLDEAYAAVAVRVGETQARSLFDGSAVGVVARATHQIPLRSARL